MEFYGVQVNDQVATFLEKANITVKCISEAPIHPLQKIMILSDKNYGFFVEAFANTIFVTLHLRQEPELINYVILHESGHLISKRLGFMPAGPFRTRQDGMEEEYRADSFAMHMMLTLSVERSENMMRMWNERNNLFKQGIKEDTLGKEYVTREYISRFL